MQHSVIETKLRDWERNKALPTKNLFAPHEDACAAALEVSRARALHEEAAA